MALVFSAACKRMERSHGRQPKEDKETRSGKTRKDSSARGLTKVDLAIARYNSTGKTQTSRVPQIYGQWRVEVDRSFKETSGEVNDRQVTNNERSQNDYQRQPGEYIGSDPR